MFEPFKRKHTSPWNRYLEANSLDPVHRRMPTPSVTPAPISYPVSSQPPLQSPRTKFQIHKGTISARKCRLAYRQYWSVYTVYFSTEIYVYICTEVQVSVPAILVGLYCLPYHEIHIYICTEVLATIPAILVGLYCLP